MLFNPVRIQEEQEYRDLIPTTVRYLFGRLFGCWHRQMTRPFTRGKRTYRTCSRCGMRRDFDLKTWRMKGRYYREPVVASLISTTDPSDVISNPVPKRDSQTHTLHLLR
jgi:hypothetical protein